MKIAEVFLNQTNKRIDHAYDYQIPQQLEAVIEVGMRVVVSFGIGNRRVEGFVIRIKESTDYSGKTKEICENIDTQSILNKEQIELCLWMKTVYCSLFYEALSYFTMSVQVKQEIGYFKKQGSFDLNLKENWFIEHYFTDDKNALLIKKVKPEDRLVLTALIEKKVVYAKKNWKIISDSSGEDSSAETSYRLTALGKEAIDRDKKIGKKQRELMECLRRNDMTAGDLKMVSTQFEKSLSSLILKKYIIKYKTLAQAQRLNLPGTEKKDQSVILTSREQHNYNQYRELTKVKPGVFFHVFDGASKYRLFFKAIEDQLKSNKSAVVIFPEVNMTFQRMEMFYKYFGEQVGVFHGRLTPKQRSELHQRVQEGELKVVIGVRSALFLPFKKLGLIIIDDEHDPSHISISTPRFHIADIAKKASEIMATDYIIADDTPRVATWYQIERKELAMIQIGEVHRLRHTIEIIDMQNEMHQGNMGILSRILLKYMRSGFEQKRMSVLFINNKGYANSVLCRNCGHIAKCPHCGISLKYFNHDHSLHCHYCGYKMAIPQRCPDCGSDKIRHMGFGIDQLEEYLRKVIPGIRIGTVQGNMKRAEIKKMNKAIASGEIDVLIGTQVIIKHFNLTNVGVAAAVLIDRDLNQGNYQASETVYQTYSRFFEKAMDGTTKGLIQTHEPENETIYSIKNESFQEFYRGEIRYREMMKYPPIVNMVSFSIFQKNEREVENDAFRLYVAIKEELKKYGIGHAVYKPVRIGVTRGGNITYQIVLKSSEPGVFQNLMPEIIRLGIIEELKSKVSIQKNL
ncbi:replication restart helicase PriA [Acetobacterium malicum]|uniref:replication restart helicase PriA n=1 Tax=Acetobacterium malicum TaxID=52692 RepID=UPI003593E508